MAWRPPLTLRGTHMPARLPLQASKPAETVALFIKNSELPEGELFSVVTPEHITSAAPGGIKRPPYPEARQAALQMLEPCVFFVQYPCPQGCRSLGICIHYQFVAGCRRCPDGLWCPACVQNVEEVAIKATRRCPLHQDLTQANPLSNRPEDFLATERQKEYYAQVLQRSVFCQWDDLPPPSQNKDEEADLEAATHLGRLNRGATPRDLQDVQMLETMHMDDITVEESQTNMTEIDRSAWSSDSSRVGEAVPRASIGPMGDNYRYQTYP